MLRLFWTTAGQVVFVLAFVLLVAFVASVALTLAKFSDALSNAVSARYDIHATDLRTNMETGVNLGLDLTEIAGNVEVVVRNRLALDDGILRIVVTAADGSEVFAIDRAGERPGPEAERSLPIRNSFGGVEGHVTVVYRTGAHSGVIRDAAQSLLQDALVITAVAAIAAGLACLLVMVPLMRSILRAREILVRSGTAPPGPVGRGHALEVAAQRAVSASQATQAELARVEAELTAQMAGNTGRED